MPTCESCNAQDDPTVHQHRHVGAYGDMYIMRECAWCSGEEGAGTEDAFCQQCDDANAVCDAVNDDGGR